MQERTKIVHVPLALNQLRNDHKSRYKTITKRYGACVLHSLQTFIDRIYCACQAIDNSLSSRQAARFKRQSFYVAIGKISSRSTTRVIFHASLDNYEFRWIVQLLVVKPRCNGDYGLTVYPLPVHTIVLTSFNRTVDCPFFFSSNANRIRFLVFFVTVRRLMVNGHVLEKIAVSKCKVENKHRILLVRGNFDGAICLGYVIVGLLIVLQDGDGDKGKFDHFKIVDHT